MRAQYSEINTLAQCNLAFPFCFAQVDSHIDPLSDEETLYRITMRRRTLT